jgi:hypothetical protein
LITKIDERASEGRLDKLIKSYPTKATGVPDTSLFLHLLEPGIGDRQQR